MSTSRRIGMVLLVAFLGTFFFLGSTCQKKEKDDQTVAGSSTAAPAPGTPGSSWIEPLAVDLEVAKQWNDTTAYPAGSFPYKTYWQNANTNVPVDRVVLLSGDATPPAGATISNYSWSGATFSYLGGDTSKPYFTPSSAGQYPITMIVTFSDGTTSTAVLTVTAAKYVGKSNCAGCHSSIYNSWLRVNATDRMNHADVWAMKTTGKRTSFSSGSCFGCHTTGYDYGMLGTGNPDCDGWDDPSRHGLGTDGSSWYTTANAGLSGNYENPVGSGIWYTQNTLSNQPVMQADLNGIQCEQCHGPASMHYGDPSAISKPYSESTCTAKCHGDYTWNQSGHSQSIGMSLHKSSACNECHTAQGYVNVMEKGNPGVTYAQANPITCMACHNVHEATSDYMLRFEGEADVSGTEVNAHDSAVCVKCHTDEGATVGKEPHHPQSEMLYGTLIGGGKGYNYAGKTYANMEHSTEVEEGCAQCHMAGTIAPVGKYDPGAPKTVLAEAITATTSSFTIGAYTSFPTSGTLRIGKEQMTYSALSSSAPYTVVVTLRGANGTTAASHSIGDLVTYGSGSRDRIGGHSWNIRDDVIGDDTETVTSPTAWFSYKSDNHYAVEGCNSCHRQFNAPETTLNGDALRTNLTGGLAVDHAAITVSSTTGFPSSGTIQVGAEQITYTSTTATTFEGITRGANGTGPAYSASTANKSSKYAVVAADTITVTDTSEFPDSGVLLIEYQTKSGNRNIGAIKEKIVYTGKTATTFTGCYRGAVGGTSVIAHPTGTTITLLANVQALLVEPALGVADNITVLSTTLTSSNLISITIGSDTGWPLSGGEAKIESEFVSFTHTASGDNSIWITARGLYGTAAAAHTASLTSPKVYFPALTGTATTLFVADTTGFPSSGIVKISAEYIKYTGKTATSLTGLTRGAAGTMAVPHMPYESVELQLFSPYVDATPVAAQIPTFQKTVVTMLSTLEALLPKTSSGSVSYNSGTTAQQNAAFNYYFVKNDGSMGIHNYKYAMQLLWDSITDLGGTPPYSRP